jgi:asparagine synthase (glutamine-hydrolysing)
MGHRGPDDEGIAVGEGWVLGHRRLSILDLSSRGHQPMSDDSDTMVISFNGEIYNFKELRAQLQRQGCTFRSSTDTEVLLQWVKEKGDKGLAALDGMFAFACVDKRRNALLLCRDRFGIKPLYYTRINGLTVFASEVKAILSFPGMSAKLDGSHFREYLQYRFVAGEETLFSGVRELQPACLIRCDFLSADPKQMRYVDLPLHGKAEDATQSEIADRLSASVKAQLVSDVPVGTQLSGGLDSSLVTALAIEAGAKDMHSFSISFTEAKEDESAWAYCVASALGTLHHSIAYAQNEFLEDLAYCSWLNDTPLNHANSVPMHRMCVTARKYVPVLLTGEGADELFGGYYWHRRLFRLAAFRGIAGWRGIGWLARHALAGNVRGALGDVFGKSIRDMALNASKWNSDNVAEKLLLPSVIGRPVTLGQDISLNDENILWAGLDTDLRRYLVSVLQRQDRMSMGASVETRVPFLGNEVVAAALRLPTASLFDSDGNGKDVLRKIALSYLPDVVVHRAKVGFSAPLGSWFSDAHGLGALLGWLWNGDSAGRGLWRPEVVRKMVEDNANGKRSHADVLWPLLSFEIWARIWLDGHNHNEVCEQIARTRADSKGSPGINESKNSRGGEGLSRRVRRLSVSVPVVCHVIPSLEVGGMERVVEDLFAWRRNRGRTVVVFCTDKYDDLQSRIPESSRDCGHRRDMPILLNMCVVSDLVAFLREHDVDVIHAHNHLAHLYAVAAGYRLRLPVVVTHHGQGRFDLPRTVLLRRLLARMTRGIVAVSDDAKRVFVDKHVALEGDIWVIRNGIDLAQYRAADATAKSDRRKQLGIQEATYVFGSVGRFAWEKDYPSLVMALSILVNKMNLDVTLALVGDGSDMRRICDLVQTLKLEKHVLLPGMQADVRPWLEIMDVFCLSSLSEGTSITLLESAAVGLPAVVTTVGGNSEVVKDGMSGILVPPGDVEAMAMALNRLYLNPDLRKTMGEAALSRVRRSFSIEQMAWAYEAVYRQADKLYSG